MAAIADLFRNDQLASASDELTAHLRSILVAIRSRAGGGAGTIWSGDGLIVTNHHVVPADEAEVILPDERAFRARVISRDPDRDLAALRIDAVGLASAKPADSDNVRVGQLVFAMGNPWGQRGALTAGIVLAKGPATIENQVPLEEAIRADVRLAPGNSGGPLADAEGRVVGINSMIAGGMAVAVPSNSVERFLAGDVPGTGFIGIAGRGIPLPPAVAASFEADDGGGLLVTDVTDGSPAAKAGLIPGDVILRVAGAAGFGRVSRRLTRARPGQAVKLEFLRAWDVHEAEVEPGVRS